MLDEEAGMMKVLNPEARRGPNEWGEPGQTIHNSHNPWGGQVESLMVLDSGGTGPVCANFVNKKHCILGKDCPYRHTEPGPNDRIREPVEPRYQRETWGVSRFKVL